jgi:hypothetical protein
MERALKARLNAPMNRAFSADVCIHGFPWALPKAKYEFAPLALNKYMSAVATEGGQSNSSAVTHRRYSRRASKQGLPTVISSHNIGPGNCAEAVSILVAGGVHHRSGCGYNRSHVDFSPGFPAQGCTAGESSHPIADRRLRKFECLPLVSSWKLRELARIFSSYHDAGGNAAKFAT